MAAADLTAARLRELLDYDPLTGIFTYRVSGRGRTAGRTAGRRPRAGDGYLAIRIDGRCYLAHRLVWLHVHSHWPLHEIDHRDRDRANNRLANLRDVTRTVNRQNHPTMPSIFGCTGVRPNSGRCQARIWLAGKHKHIGNFKTPAEAALAAHDARAIFYSGRVTTQAEVGRAICRVLQRESAKRGYSGAVRV